MDDYNLATDAGGEAQELSEERDVECQFVTGKAGTGKTFWAKQKSQEDPGWGMLTATTGIAAVNLGSITLNSTLKYFDTASMRDAYLSGHLKRYLHEVAKEHRYLVVDEGSMLPAEQLDLLYRGAREANRYSDLTHPLGIVLIADFAQLAPVREAWCFDSVYWPRFAANTMRMEKVWRQADGRFLEILNLVREGRGGEAAEALSAQGMRWESQRDIEFEGTTIVPVNEQVSRHNDIALDRVKGPRIPVRSRRWGVQLREWGENPRTHEWGIPPLSEFKIGAYVMILTNAQDFSTVNGDCGHIVQFSQEGFHVKLVRNDKVVLVKPAVRSVESADKPEGFDGPSIGKDDARDGKWLSQPHFRVRTKKYVLGQVEWLPLRLAYASSVHKSQSLTLDRVQLDYRHWFFGKPAMMYVAMSRCRTLAGLRMVGIKEKFVTQCQMEGRVRPWL